MSLKGESHRACLDGRVDSAYDFMVNVMIIDRFESSIPFCTFMDGRGLKCFAKSLKNFRK